jgi:Tc5 transposase DNA-binding domain
MSSNVPKVVQRAATSKPPKGDLPGAIQFMRDHPHAVISQVARDFFVHRRTLTNHLTGYSQRTRQFNGGKNKILNAEQTQAVFLYIENQAHAGFSASREMIQGAVGWMLSQERIPRLMPSSKWTYEFLKNLPLVQKAKTRPLELARAVAQQPEDVEAWFTEYIQALEYYNVYWIDIWNFDEGGFRVGCIKQGEVWIPAYMDAVVRAFLWRMI